MSEYRAKIDEEWIDLAGTKPQELDIVHNGDNNYHLLKDNNAYSVNLLDIDPVNKMVSLSINGNTYHVDIEDNYDQLVDQMGLADDLVQKMSNIKAPMPGLILDILVKPGDTIESGTQLAILEAMKMENVLKSDGDGIVKSIEVTKGQSVEKGQILIEMEEEQS